MRSIGLHENSAHYIQAGQMHRASNVSGILQFIRKCSLPAESTLQSVYPKRGREANGEVERLLSGFAL